MLRPAHGRRRVGGQHLTSDQPVEQHPHGSELLLHARRRVLLLQALALLAPGEEPGACPGIGQACMCVVDVGGEEFDVAPAGVITEIGDKRRHNWRRAQVGGT